MFPVTSMSNQLPFITVRIDTKGKTGTGSATGFFFSKPAEGGKNRPILVTNKHVVQGADDVYFHLSLCKDDADEPSGKHFCVSIKEASGIWVDHPDPDVDLCATPFGPLYKRALANGQNVFHRNIDVNMIRTDEELSELNAVEDVLMIGYPKGIWDEKHNLPIIRKGITATHPCIDYQGKPECIVDISCWHGSSGSPVLIANEGSYATPQGLTVGNRLIFIGVLYAGPVLTAEGRAAVLPIPAYEQDVPMNKVLINLGYLVKAREVSVLHDIIMQKIEAAGSMPMGSLHG